MHVKKYVKLYSTFHIWMSTFTCEMWSSKGRNILVEYLEKTWDVFGNTYQWRSISTQENIPRTEHFPKFVSANHILQNFLFAENFNCILQERIEPQWKVHAL
jgi:hypothetical protein